MEVDGGCWGWSFWFGDEAASCVRHGVGRKFEVDDAERKQESGSGSGSDSPTFGLREVLAPEPRRRKSGWANVRKGSTLPGQPPAARAR